MPTYRFDYTVAPEGLTVGLSEQSRTILLGKRRNAVPLKEWTSERLPFLSGLARVQALIEAHDGSAILLNEGTGVRLTHSAVADLTDAQALSIGLPPAPPFDLSISTTGALTDPHTRISGRWISRGIPVPTTRIGAVLRAEGAEYRLPRHLLVAVEAVEAFAETPDDFEQRLAALARLRSALPEEAVLGLSLDEGLASVRIAHATAFSLDVRARGNDLDLAPILFGKEVAERAADGTARVSESESILTPAQQEKFSRDRFSAFDHARTSYVIESGVFVYVDPGLRRALDVVRKAQLSADPAPRRRLARDPQVFLAEQLTEGGSALDEDVARHLFVETLQFSQRVIEVGIWHPPVLPWIKREPRTWLPEEFGLRVGETIVPIKPSEFGDLRKAVTEAMERGDSTVSFKGHTIPASRPVLESIETLVTEVSPRPKPQPDPSVTTDKQPPRGRHVFVLRENFTQVDFDAHLRPRSTLTPVDHAPLSKLKPRLKAHQEEGLSWLKTCWAIGRPGALLADDMGLGKTLQALVFLSWLQEARERLGFERLPVLIVAPTGLLRNWEAENTRHLSDSGLGIPLRAYGSELRALRGTAGADIHTGSASLDTARLRSAPWIVTSYETLRDYSLSFGALKLACVVFDEAQRIKNPQSLNTNAAKSLNADFVLGMTGTPIENSVEDLWCIFDAILPGFLGDLRAFSDRYQGGDREALASLSRTLMDSEGPDHPAPMLRRMKADRLEGLPIKHEKSLRGQMPPEQADAYKRAIANGKSGGGRSMLQTLHYLRGISLHPFTPTSANKRSVAEFIELSARLKQVVHHLDQVARDKEKALIFLESLDFQEILATLLKDRYGLDHLPMRINGSVAGPARQKMVDRFQDAPREFDVLILSPRAAGVGLTLTAANHVFHLSRWWNPAVEDQCTDRAYRIGQSRPVHVYYPMAIHPEYGAGTFDVILDDLLNTKRSLSRSVLTEPNSASDLAFVGDKIFGAAKPDPTPLADIDRMEPQAFERWAIDRMVHAGWQAASTPKSHDGGADAIFARSGEHVILQCKHCQVPDRRMDEAAVDDLLRARVRYDLPSARLVALTNARSFSAGATARAAEAGIVLVSREHVLQWPGSVL